MNDNACFCHKLIHSLEFAHLQKREYMHNLAGKVGPASSL